MSQPAAELHSPGAWDPPAELGAASRKAWIVGAVGVAASVLGAVLDPTQFLRSYLVAWLLWLGVALGCLAISMLHHLSRGVWGLMIRRVLEAGARTLPALALLFLPILFGVGRLYVWAQPERVAADPLLQHKAPYLNLPGFVGRTVLYFLIWCGFAFVLDRLSRRQDSTGDPRLSRRMQVIAAPGLAAYCLAATFASIDWVMSLDPHWSSTIFGASFVVGQAVAGFAFVIAVALYLSRRRPMEGVLAPAHFHDYGKLLLAFVMLWAYFAVSQFLIIWAGNLPEEISYYQARRHGGWLAISVALALLHFALPFLLLLSRDLKRSGRLLVNVAIFLLAMRWLDLYWQTAPAFSATITFHWLDLATVAGVGGVWLGLFFWQLGKRPLLPAHDPFLPEALGRA